MVTTSRLDGRTNVLSSTTATAADDAVEDATELATLVVDDATEDNAAVEDATATADDFATDEDELALLELLLPPQPVNMMTKLAAKPYFKIELSCINFS